MSESAPTVGPRAWIARRVFWLVPSSAVYLAAVVVLVAHGLGRCAEWPPLHRLVESSGTLVEGCALLGGLATLATFLMAAWRTAAAATASGLAREARIAWALATTAAFVASVAVLIVIAVVAVRWNDGRLTFHSHQAGKAVLAAGMLGAVGVVAAPWFLVRAWRRVERLGGLRPGSARDLLPWLMYPSFGSRLRLAVCPDLFPTEKSVLGFDDLHLTTERVLVLDRHARVVAQVPRSQIVRFEARFGAKAPGWAARYALGLSFTLEGGATQVLTLDLGRYQPGLELLAHLLLGRSAESLQASARVIEAARSLLDERETPVVAAVGCEGGVSPRPSFESGTVLTNQRLFTFERGRVTASFDVADAHAALVSESWRGSRGRWRRFAVTAASGRSITFSARAIDAYDLLASLLGGVESDQLALIPSPTADLDSIEAEGGWVHAIHAGV